MSGSLRMAAEVRGWLRELAISDPGLARRVGQAVVALAAHGSDLRAPLVVPVPRRAPLARGAGPDPGDALDEAHLRLLGLLTGMRRRIAGIVTARRRIELLIDASPAAEASLRRQRDDLLAAEAELTADVQRMQRRVEEFRTRKEVLRAAYLAARAQQALNDASAGQGEGPGRAAVPFPGAGEAAAAALAAINDVLEVADDLARDIGAVPGAGGGAPPGGATGGAHPGGAAGGAPGRAEEGQDRPAAGDGPPGGLQALRPGAPDCLGVQVLFAAPEGEGSARDVCLLAAAVSHPDALAGPEDLAAVALSRYQASQAGATMPSYTSESFTAEFFPGDSAAILAGADALVAAGRPQPLTDLRRRSALTQAQVAQRLGVRQERVSAIERGDPGSSEIRTLAAYVEALGGRLEITADFGTVRVPLR